jgi:small subunit ribosomal protein S1
VAEGYDDQRGLGGPIAVRRGARWEAHVKQQEEAAKAEVEAGRGHVHSSGTETGGG